MGVNRRDFLRQVGVIALGPSLLQMAALARACPVPSKLGPLQPPDANGIRLPAGFSSRVVAVSGQTVPGTNYVWHGEPDGGAVYEISDGGWIYVSNAELGDGNGGAGALRFDAKGNIVDAYPILRGTSVNCAGGSLPGNTWLSCEEVDFGRVWQCDIFGKNSPIVRDALGWFKHEAVAYDPVHYKMYLTEDTSNGRLYRFSPFKPPINGVPQVDAGCLEVATWNQATTLLSWSEVPNPNPVSGQAPTRLQVPGSTVFNGGEGIWYHDGLVYFTTKGDNKVWELDTVADSLRVVYSPETADIPLLTGVDNVMVSPGGQVLVAEDGGDMQLVVLEFPNRARPLLQIENQDNSEICGPDFDPSGTRLYLSSQRGSNGNGITYEISGPFCS